MTDFDRIDPYLRATYILRLARLVRLRREFSRTLNDLGLDMLDRAIEATVKDCAWQGAAGQAETILSALRSNTVDT